MNNMINERDKEFANEFSRFVSGKMCSASKVGAEFANDHRFLVNEQFKQYPLYSQDGKKKEAICLCVFFIGKIRWYVLEGQPEGDDFTLFSIVVGLADTEYGYVFIKEMESISVDVGHNLFLCRR